MTPKREFMPFWTEKSPQGWGAVTNFVATFKIGGFSVSGLQNPNLYKDPKLQVQLRPLSDFKILQTLSAKNPHSEGGDKSGDTLGGGARGTLNPCGRVVKCGTEAASGGTHEPFAILRGGEAWRKSWWR